MKKRRIIGKGFFLAMAFFVLWSLILPFYDESITGGQTFFKVASAIILGLAVYAISSAFEDKSSE